MAAFAAFLESQLKGTSAARHPASRSRGPGTRPVAASKSQIAWLRSMYLLDTNVVSELRRKKPHGAVLAWIESVADSNLHLAAATIGEIQAGIEITRERDEAKAAEIEAWLEDVAASYNVLAMDATSFRYWARLMHRRSDRLIEDAMIAATALAHNLTVVTRNTRDFEAFGVLTLNPFEARR
jgi:toxin FitB